MNISAISIYVTDLEAATRFYTEVLGFRIERTLGDYATKLESASFSLLLCAGATGLVAPPPYPSGVVLGLPTPNLEKRIEELRTHGARFLQDKPEPFPMGRFIAFVDPFGVTHELLEYQS